MEARRLSVAEDVRREDVVQPVEGVETESEASVVPTESELPSSLSTVLLAVPPGGHNRV